MIKQSKFHHSITQLGNIQVRIKEEYIDDDGKIKHTKFSDPMTPADTKTVCIDGWDDRTIAIIEAITDKDVSAAFELEKSKDILFRNKRYKHISQVIGVGIEEAVAIDFEILYDNRIAIRYIYRLFEDGNEIKKEYHRDWINPGNNTLKHGILPYKVAEKIHTKEIIDAYKDSLIEKEGI